MFILTSRPPMISKSILSAILLSLLPSGGYGR